MQIDPEDFRRRFEDLSDDALLAVNRDELVDAARELLDAELDRRGLSAEAETSPEEQPAVEEAADPKEELVVADEFTSAQELAFAHSLLKSAGIPCYTDSDFPIGAAATTGGLRLFVPASLLEQAQEILDAPLSEEDLEAQAEAAGSAEDIEEAEHEETEAEDEEPNRDDDIPA